MKTCHTCGIEKNDSEFYGKLNRCKGCCLAYTSEWQKRNPEKVKAIRERHKDKQKEYYRRWYAEKGRQRKSDYGECIKSWGIANPAAARARRVIRVAITNGDLACPSTCSRCGRGCRLHAHHDDYAKPLDVVWLCASCHKLHHEAQK